MLNISRDQGDGPAMVPPLGVIPVLSRTSPDQKWYFICVPLVTVLPGLFIMLRLYSKIKIVRKVDLTDWAILFSFVIFIVNVCLARIAVHYGLGVHQWNLRLEDYMQQLYWINVNIVLYCPTIFLIKTSIVLQYFQIFAPVRTGNGLMYYGGWCIIIVMLIFYTASIPITLLVCNPLDELRNPQATGSSCKDNTADVIASALFNILSDLLILLFPVRSICKLRIRNSKKFAIIALFAIGLLATLASSMRLLYTFKLGRQGDNQDPSYEMAWMGLWTWAEVALGFIIACTLSLPKLVRAKSEELSSFFSSVARPFTSIKSLFRTTRDRIKSDQTGGERSSADQVTTKAPWIRDYVHAPPGLTLNSNGGSFIIHDYNDDMV